MKTKIIITTEESISKEYKKNRNIIFLLLIIFHCLLLSLGVIHLIEGDLVHGVFSVVLNTLMIIVCIGNLKL